VHKRGKTMATNAVSKTSLSLNKNLAGRNAQGSAAATYNAFPSPSKSKAEVSLSRRYLVQHNKQHRQLR